MSTFFEDQTDSTKKVACNASGISGTKTLLSADRDVDLNDPENPALPHSFTAPQSYTPYTMGTPGVFDVSQSNYQKFTAVADTTLSLSASPTPCTVMYIEIDPASFVISVPVTWDAYGRYSQPSTTDKFMLTFFVRSDSSIELRHVT